MKIGVLLDEPKILPGFDYTFYEVKPSSGRVFQALPGAWNVVNCFADNTKSRTSPDLVATFNGERAIRGTPKRFLWDWICPSRPDYREYCRNIIVDIARTDIDGIRLDSVCFPREGYCDCGVCAASFKKSGKDLVEWRSDQIESFVREVRKSVACGLGLTLEPDPCFGKERFGLDLTKLVELVDYVSTPLYMDYSIVYWLDILANCFKRKTPKPYFIELYASHPRARTEHIASALAVATEYADCVILSTYEAKAAEALQREMVHDARIRTFFEERDCKPLLQVLDNWQNLF